MSEALSIHHDQAGHQFETTVDGHRAYLTYMDLGKQTPDIYRTFVPNALRGRGIAAALTEQALDYAEKMIPAINVPYDWANGAFQMAESYYQLGQNEKANKIIDELANKSLEYMIWYLSLNDNQLAIASENFVYNASLLDAEVRLMEKYKSEELAKHYSTQLDQLYNEYVTRMKGK